MQGDSIRIELLPWMQTSTIFNIKHRYSSYCKQETKKTYKYNKIPT